jgi:hypothetical protein
LFLTPKGKQWVNLISNIKSMSFKEVESHDQDQWESQDLG